jgi:multidrug resistance efflux pump
LLPLHKNKIAQQKEAVEASRLRLSGARHKLARGKELVDMNFMSKEDYAAAEDQVKELEAADRAEQKKLKALETIDEKFDVLQAEAQVAAKKAQRDAAEFALKETVLRAPDDGIVLRVNVGAGDVLGPTPREAAVLFCPNRKRVIRVNVEQEFASYVKVGHAAEVRDPNDIEPSHAWKGKVVRVADIFMKARTLLPEPISFLAQDNPTLEAQVVLDPGQPPLRIGQNVRVIIRPGLQ